MTDYRITLTAYIHADNQTDAHCQAKTMLAVIKTADPNTAAWIERIQDTPSLNENQEDPSSPPTTSIDHDWPEVSRDDRLAIENAERTYFENLARQYTIDADVDTSAYDAWEASLTTDPNELER